MANQKQDSDHVLTAICSYLGILVLIPLLAVKKRDDFIRFHINQGLTLFIVELIAMVGIAVIAMIPFIGWMISMLGWLIYLAFVIVSIVAIVKALAGEQWKIPGLTFRIVDIK
jgi:uncharacterized membrane protein